MTEKEKENRIHSFALSFLERQQIVPNLYADQIIRGYKEGYHQAEKDLKVEEVEEPSKDLKEAARRAAVDKPDTPLEFLMERPYDSVKEQKFIEGAMWQKRHDNIPQELVENYCEFIKEGGKNVCALINAVNACNAKKAECISNELEDEATKYAQDKYMPVQTAEAFRAGYNKCRQEMMNSAIEREVKVDAGGYPYIDATELYDYENDKPFAKAGDKVKVMFIKDK